MTWQITQVVPGQVVARQLVSPDPGHKFVADRRDSVAQIGDSTLVVSTTTTPGPTSSATSSVLALSMFRVQSKIELMALKAHVEFPGSTTTIRR